MILLAKKNPTATMKTRATAANIAISPPVKTWSVTWKEMRWTACIGAETST